MQQNNVRTNFSFVIRSEHSRMFKPEKFYNYVCKHGYNEQLFGKTSRQNVLEFYRRFIYSSNFKIFVQYRIKEAYYNDLMHVNMKNFLKQNLISDVALIDLFLRVKQDLEEEQGHEGYFAGDVIHVNIVCEKLQEFLKDIINLLPDNLKQSFSVGGFGNNSAAVPNQHLTPLFGGSNTPSSNNSSPTVSPAMSPIPEEPAAVQQKEIAKQEVMAAIQFKTVF